jgi:EAL domain-containing protein (putative c-di-GMP-specific phosphodiesterase class I)
MILALGRSLGLTVIAEGVETEAQQSFLVEHGCHAYQGYMYGRPMEAGSFESYLVRLETKAVPCKVIRLDGGRSRPV